MIAFGLAPFVGRQLELGALRELLAVTPVVSVHGGAGAGKSRLVAELAPTLGVPHAIITCYPGDRASAVRARAERGLRCVAGTLTAALTQDARALVIDDIHHLHIDELINVLAPLLRGPRALGRVILIGRDPLAIARDAISELAVGELDDAATVALWTSLVATFGAPSAEHGLSAALAPVRGLPLAIRHDYARARFGSHPWELASLDPRARAALDALAVLRIPVGPTAVAALAFRGGESDATAPEGVAAPEGTAAPVGSPERRVIDIALSELVTRQLVDTTADGRLVVFEVVRDDVLAQLDPVSRHRLHARAAELVARAGHPATPFATFDALDPVARVREVGWHWIAAGELDRASEWVVEHRGLAARSGAGGELEALIEAIDGRGSRVGVRDGSVPSREHAHELVRLRVEIAARGGRVSEASARALSNPGIVPALLDAGLRAATLDIVGARRVLAGLALAPELSDRMSAGAALVELDLLAGRPDDAAAQLATALGDATPAQLAAAHPLARARIDLATARVDDYRGQIAATRAALARAHGACHSVSPSLEASELEVIIDARRAIGLAREGRLIEAAAALDAADAASWELDSSAVVDEVASARALIMRRSGDSGGGSALLHQLVRTRRVRGDELGALRAELDLAELEVVRGQPAIAAELANAAIASSARHDLGHLTARGHAVVAAVDVLEYRLDAALPRLTALDGQPALDASSAAEVAVVLAATRALTGQRTGAIELARNAGAECRDDIDRMLAGARVALAAGDVAVALELARGTAVLAERARRTIELAHALVIIARLELARGDRAAARAAATRGAREATAAGLVRARIHALLALSALARDDDDAQSALAYARDASELAVTAGLPVERLVSHAALDAISGAEAVADPSAPSAATMSPTAIEAAARLLTDLGLTAQRPFRVIDADGVHSDVADANPEVLRLSGRALAVDGVREVIWRHGQELADLRRRSLLKRLLFLFASAPGKVFSKESIVQAVWNVDYHPLRHDAALFTNIMRIRRLLGEDGSEIIRVTEDGYRFVPPRDFLFVIPR